MSIRLSPDETRPLNNNPELMLPQFEAVDVIEDPEMVLLVKRVLVTTVGS